jgi:multidrug resistance efflux pump
MGAYKELDQLRLDIARLTLTSPVSGTIASAAPLHVGEYIAAGSVVAAIYPESDPLVVESWLLSSDRTFISSGQTVRLRRESSLAPMDGGFDGKVSFISPDVRTSETGAAAYRVVIVPSFPDNLQLGATFDVHFVTRNERLLFLPFQRIRREFQEAF